MNPSPEASSYAPARAWFAKGICLVTIGLIFVGGVVTSNNAGLAVPDWPTSFGYQMWAMPFALWQGGIFYEHSHRVLASILGVLVLAMAVWLMATERHRPVRLLGLTCLALVIVQGILGGVGVLLSLPVLVSVMHGVLAQLFFCLTIVLAYALSRERHMRLREPPVTVDRCFVRGVVVVGLLIAAQLVLAAYMRHDLKFQGGVAIPDAPTTAGRWLPWVDAQSVAWVNAWRERAVREHGAPFSLYDPVTLHQLAVHLAHRGMAVVITAALIALSRLARRRLTRGSPLIPPLVALDALLVVQVLLGLFVVWSSRGPLITSLHVMVGAAMLGVTVLLGLRAFPPLRWGLPASATDHPDTRQVPA